MERREVRVAAYTTQQRDIRVIGIVLTHLKSQHYSFSLVALVPDAEIDIALVDANDPAMLLLLAQAMHSRPRLQVVHLVRELGQAGQRLELASYQLMMQLLPTLEGLMRRSVETSGGGGGVTPGAPSVRGATAHGASGSTLRRKLRALVVDDSQTVRAQLSNVMSRIGMACDIADGARAALAQLSAQQYDLIYVDVMMPDMDGYTLTREIKRDRRNKAPVIILTSQSSPFDRARGALAGCDIFLTKPVGMKQFYAATTKALRKSLAVDDLSGWIRDPSVPAHA